MLTFNEKGKYLHLCFLPLRVTSGTRISHTKRLVWTSLGVGSTLTSNGMVLLLLRMEQANNGDGNNKVHHFEFIEKVKIPHDSAWAKLITHVGAKAAMEMCRAITDVQGPLTARLLMMVHDIMHGSRVTFVQGPPGTGKTTTNIYLAKMHTLCQYDESNPSKIIYATLAIQNAPLVQATRDIVRWQTEKKQYTSTK